MLRIGTPHEDRPVAGVDSCIAGREGLTVGQPVTAGLLRDVAVLSHQMAVSIGEVLHHAEWQITADPAVVEEIGMHGRPDCARCRSGVDRALAALADNGRPLLVGTLFWAG